MSLIKAPYSCLLLSLTEKICLRAQLNSWADTSDLTWPSVVANIFVRHFRGAEVATGWGQGALLAQGQCGAEFGWCKALEKAGESGNGDGRGGQDYR